MAAANATSVLRIGSFVYNNDFRHPALLAKEAATIDVLSGGRLELGIGAGYSKSEYDAVGVPFDPPGVRARRFEEAIEVIRRLLRSESVEYQGQHYRLSGYAGLPMPVQRPVPLLIGGGGPRMIRFAARTADIVGFIPQSLTGGGIDPGEFAPVALESKVGLLEKVVSETGRTDGTPERNILIFGIYPSVDAIAEGDRVLRYVPRQLLATSPYVLLGDVGAIVEGLRERRERWGLTYYVCWGDQIDKFIPVVRQLAG
jgi:probable F420-dependent oxidoreductase